MINRFSTRVPFYHTLDIDEQPNLVASQPNNGAHFYAAIQPPLLTPEFVIEKINNSQALIDYIKIKDICDGTEYTISYDTDKVKYWQGENGKSCVAYSGFDLFIQGDDCEKIWQYIVKFTDDSVRLYYSDYFVFDPAASTSENKTAAIASAVDDCTVAGIAHSRYENESEGDKFHCRVYIPSREYEVLQEVEEEVERDLNGTDIITSVRTVRSVVLVYSNCHIPVYDQIVRMNHYVGKGLSYSPAGVNDSFEVITWEVQEPDYEAGGEYSPTVRVRLRYLEHLNSTSCCDEIDVCEEYSVPLQMAERETVVDRDEITVNLISHTFPENLWATVQYRAVGDTEWISADAVTLETMVNSGVTINVSTGAAIEIRTCVSNFNCDYGCSLIATIQPL